MFLILSNCLGWIFHAASSWIYFGKYIPLRGSLFPAGGKRKPAGVLLLSCSYVGFDEQLQLLQMGGSRVCQCWVLQPGLVGLGWDGTILPYYWVSSLPSHSGFPPSFWAVTRVKLSIGDEGQWNRELCSWWMQGTKVLGCWRCNILKTEFHHSSSACPFPKATLIKYAPHLTRKAYSCRGGEAINFITLLHQEPNGVMKPIFPDMIFSHKALTLLHIWWEFLSSKFLSKAWMIWPTSTKIYT